MPATSIPGRSPATPSRRSARGRADPPRRRDRAGALRAVPRPRPAERAGFPHAARRRAGRWRRDRGRSSICRRSRSDAPHEPEHALEVELPFLQAALGDFTLVPLVVGDAAPAEVAEVLDRLWGGARPCSWSAPICRTTSPTPAPSSTTPRPPPPSSASTKRRSGRARPAAICRSRACCSRRGGAPCASSASTFAARAIPRDRGPGGRLRRLGAQQRSGDKAMPVRLFAGSSGFSYKPWKGPF